MSITIVVNHPISTQRVPATERDLFWYNYDTQEMETHKGSHLETRYEYDDENKEWKLRPYGITDHYSKDTVLKDKVNNWFIRYQNYNHTKIDMSSDEKGITFDIPDDEEDDFTDALRRSNFKFEIR